MPGVGGAGGKQRHRGRVASRRAGKPSKRWSQPAEAGQGSEEEPEGRSDQLQHIKHCRVSQSKLH